MKDGGFVAAGWAGWGRTKVQRKVEEGWKQ